MFGKLPNVAWTNEGAISLADLPKRQLAARAQGRIIDVHSVDKFPKMANYVVPAGTRLAATSRIRLGAYVGEGTTVMHEASSTSMPVLWASAWLKAVSLQALL